MTGHRFEIEDTGGSGSTIEVACSTDAELLRAVAFHITIERFSVLMGPRGVWEIIGETKTIGFVRPVGDVADAALRAWCREQLSHPCGDVLKPICACDPPPLEVFSCNPPRCPQCRKVVKL